MENSEFIRIKSRSRNNDKFTIIHRPLLQSDSREMESQMKNSRKFIGILFI